MGPRHNMAKAGPEAALWDAEAKQKQISLAKLVGGTGRRLPVEYPLALKLHSKHQCRS
jgi:L-alanine-DL-glutamate epimerase-like enolase superfamily enzyme